MKSGKVSSFIKELNWRFGWLARFPGVLLETWRIKREDRQFESPETYRRHQIRFFSMPALRDESDKFCNIRKKIAAYAFDEGKNKSALDVATGHGFQAKALLDMGILQVVGIDIVPYRIDYCHELFKQANIDFRVMDATELEFADKTFDCATISAALHDMPREVRYQVISELVRVTRNTIVIFEPRTIKNPLFAWVYGTIGQALDESLHFKEYVQDNLPKLLLQHGLEIVHDEHVWYTTMNIKVCRVR